MQDFKYENNVIVKVKMFLGLDLNGFYTGKERRKGGGRSLDRSFKFKRNPLEGMTKAEANIIKNKADLKEYGRLINNAGHKLHHMFVLFGVQYSTNLKRSREYKLDNHAWVPKKITLIKKLKMIYNGEVRQLNKKAK